MTLTDAERFRAAAGGGGGGAAARCGGTVFSRPDPRERAARRTDLSRAMQRLKPRDRAMLWLAYAEGSSHREIAQAPGGRPGSMKMLLFRARRRPAALPGGAR